MVRDSKFFVNRRSLRKLFIGFLKMFQYLSFGDFEGSRSHIVIILDVEYIASGAEYGVWVNGRLTGSYKLRIQ